MGGNDRKWKRKRLFSQRIPRGVPKVKAPLASPVLEAALESTGNKAGLGINLWGYKGAYSEWSCLSGSLVEQNPLAHSRTPAFIGRAKWIPWQTNPKRNRTASLFCQNQAGAIACEAPEGTGGGRVQISRGGVKYSISIAQRAGLIWRTRGLGGP